MRLPIALFTTIAVCSFGARAFADLDSGPDAAPPGARGIVRRRVRAGRPKPNGMSPGLIDTAVENGR